MQMWLRLSLLYTRQSITVDCVMCVLDAVYKMIRFTGRRIGNRPKLFKLIYCARPMKRIVGRNAANKQNQRFAVGRNNGNDCANESKSNDDIASVLLPEISCKIERNLKEYLLLKDDTT